MARFELSDIEWRLISTRPARTGVGRLYVEDLIVKIEGPRAR